MNYGTLTVLTLGGGQHHLVGITPTVPVSCTLKGVREGRDEVLEKTLEILRPNVDTL